MESTNMSDAYKYFVCRREWVTAMKEQKFDGGLKRLDPVVY